MNIGTNILTKNKIEVSHISSVGLWLFVDDAEFFVSFQDYPDLLNATISQLSEVTVDSIGDFHWEELDVDIERNALEEPEKYPLRFRA